MKITVKNFKGIVNLPDFPLNAINILAGANSGGKSSLIHLLLLIKQTLEARSQDIPLKLNKPYVALGRFDSIVRKVSSANLPTKEFTFGLFLELEDLVPRLQQIFSGKHKVSSRYETKEISGFKGVRISVTFRKPSEKIVVSKFNVEIVADSPLRFDIEREPHGRSYILKTNALKYFLKRFVYPSEEELSQEVSIKCAVSFLTFFPDFIESKELEDTYEIGFNYSQLIDLLRTSVNKYFSRISYLGPLREEPHEFYFQDDEFVEHIGNKGENAAFILSKHAKDKTTYRCIDQEASSQPIVVEKKGSLLDAVNYWLCDVFNLARNVVVQKVKTNSNIYTVGLRNSKGTVISITHVGFGISQVFPILVEGLRPTSHNRLIILEQPEIHLHPRVQAWLFDFVNLVDAKVSFLIETHSDHFINRLRRRIAESDNDEVLKKVNLTFVNRNEDGVAYEHLSLNEIGIFNHWPDGFIDQLDSDLQALVRAQSAKRLKK